MSSFMKLTIGIISAALCLAVPCAASDEHAGAKSKTLWTTGSALMPGWGLYPNSAQHDGSEVLGQQAAWGTGQLMWIVHIPTRYVIGTMSSV